MGDDIVHVQQLLVGELDGVLGSWRRQLGKMSAAQRAKLAQNALFQELEKAREHVLEASAGGVDVLAVLSALLRVVRSDATSGAVTLAALHAVQALLIGDALAVLCATTALRRVAARRIVAAVAHCRFEASDHESDEVVLAAIVRVLAQAVQCGLGAYLSVRDVEHCIGTCAKMSAQTRLSYLLRRHADHALTDILAALNARYRQADAHLSAAQLDSAHSSDHEALLHAADDEDDDEDDDDLSSPTPATATATATAPAAHDATSASNEAPRTPEVHRVTSATGTEKVRRVRSASEAPSSPGVGKALSAEQTELAPEESPEEQLAAVTAFLCAQLDTGDGKRTALQRAQTLALLQSVCETQRRTPPQRRGALLTRTLVDTLALHALQVVQRALMPHLTPAPPTPNPAPIPVPAPAELEVLARGLRVLQTLWHVHGAEQRVTLDLLLTYVTTALGDDVAPMSAELRDVLVDALVSWARDTALLHALVVQFDAHTRAASWASRLVQLLARLAESASQSQALAAQDALTAVLRGLHARLRESSGAGDSDGAKATALAELQKALAHKETLRATAQIFNEKPSRGVEHAQQQQLLTLSGDQGAEDAARVAAYLRANPFLNPRAVGEYLGDKKDFSQRVLEAYVATFDMRALSYVSALRVYLESFRPVGEAQVIDRYIDKWCTHYLRTTEHPERAIFASHDALFTLTYSVIMLNVELHSPVLADRPKMTLAQYTKNVEDLNDDKKFPRPFLEAIYAEIRDDEIKIHLEHAQKSALTAVTWRHLHAAQDASHALTPLSLPARHAADTLLFDVLHVPLHRALRAAALADAQQLERALALAQLSALCAAQLAHTRALDDLLSTLAQLTQLIATGPAASPAPLASAQQWGSSERAMYAAIALFTLARKHGEHVREAWPALVGCVCALSDLGLVPAALFALDDPFTLLEDERDAKPAAAPAAPAASGSWFSWLSGAPAVQPAASAPTPSSSVGSADSAALSDDPVARRLLESARRSVKQCKLRAWLQTHATLGSDALQALVRALIAASQERALSGGAVAPSALLLLDWEAQVTLLNVARVSQLWGAVSAHLEQLCAAQPRFELLSKGVLTLSRLAYALLAVDEVRVSALQIVLLVTRLALQPNNTAHNALRRKLGAAVRVSLVHNLAHIKGRTAWQLCADLVRWCAKSPLTARDALVVLAATVRGGDASSALDTVQEARATAVSEDNFALVLELLAALVRSHAYAPHARDRELSARALAQLHQLIHAVPLFCPLQRESTLEGIALSSYWLPLLQLLASLATEKAPSETPSSPPARSLPALRHQALSHLQRALLAPSLLLLSSESWQLLFEKVLFPLLEELLRAPSTAPDVLEEERLRAASILCKTFLQYLSKFIAARDFASLWLRVLHFIEAYMRAGHGELLVESVTQALKNILLVMHASGIDHGRDAAVWWPQTWTAIDRFCPKLRQELSSSMPLPAPQAGASSTQ